MIIGLGTLINTAAIVVGGVLGALGRCRKYYSQQSRAFS